jgi:hypothetical protein
MRRRLLFGASGFLITRCPCTRLRQFARLAQLADQFADTERGRRITSGFLTTRWRIGGGPASCPRVAFAGFPALRSWCITGRLPTRCGEIGVLPSVMPHTAHRARCRLVAAGRDVAAACASMGELLETRERELAAFSGFRDQATPADGSTRGVAQRKRKPPGFDLSRHLDKMARLARTSAAYFGAPPVVLVGCPVCCFGPL